MDEASWQLDRNVADMLDGVPTTLDADSLHLFAPLLRLFWSCHPKDPAPSAHRPLIGSPCLKPRVPELPPGRALAVGVVPSSLHTEWQQVN